MLFPRLRRLLQAVLATVAVVALPASAVAPEGRRVAGCTAGTLMNIVAHQDDDLLFMSPTILAAIRNGLCVRTVYVTAGDANDSAPYWTSREEGVRAAYAQLAGVDNTWTTATAGIPGHPVPVQTLVGRRTISVAFMRLPDGALDGTGGSRYGFESLQKLYAGVTNTISAVDRSSSYTLPALRDTLLALMNSYRPDRISTLDFAGDYSDGDHSDHHTVAYVVLAAQQQYTVPHTITGFEGYGIAKLPPNVANPDLATKTDAFLTYARYDPKICNTAPACAARGEGAWLSRQYTVTAPATPRAAAAPVPTPAATGTDVAASTAATGTNAAASSSATGANVAASATVTASSQNSKDGQTAVKTVDGVVDGFPGDFTHEWATAGGKAGSYLNLAFPSPVLLNRVVLYDRPNTDDQITDATLIFSDGTTVPVPPLANTGQATTIDFTARSTTSLRLSISAVSDTTVNVGLAELQAYAPELRQ